MNLMKKRSCSFWLVAIYLTIVFGAFGFMLADNQPPYVYDVSQSYVKPNPTIPGHQVEVFWKLKKINRICPGSNVRTIVDERTGASFSYDATPAMATIKFGDDHLSRTFLLPDGISTGRKIYRANLEYACNPLQRFWPLKVQTPDLHFEVEEMPK